MLCENVYLNPVGCSKANIDLEKASWQFENEGFKVVGLPAEASVGIVFGCAFIDDAKRESIDDILKLADLKRKGLLKHLVVTGCLAEKYARSTCLAFPEVDAVVGNTWLSLLPTIVRQLCEGRLRVKSWTGGPFEWARRPFRSPPTSSPWTRAVMISDGCDNACTYCSIPHMRGGLRSREATEIIEEIELVIDQGAKEIVLAGQDTASYGRDTGRGNFTQLVAQVAERFPSQWIRLSYVNSDNMDRGVGGVIRDHDNVCNYIDMPIQHASPKILAAMGREADPGVIEAKVKALRQAVPDIALRTSVIVGFPGETETDVGLLLDLLRRVEFDLVGVFAFSAQEGTPAAGLKSRVPEAIKQDRVIEVVSLQDEIGHGRMKRLVGCELEVLVEESVGDGCVAGRSQYDMAEIDRVIRITDCQARPGDFVRAGIDRIAAPYEWAATPL